MSIILNFACFVIVSNYVFAELPSLYQYYTEDGIDYGLDDGDVYFRLNNKNITLFSGALHYFRVPKEYWGDRLRKYRAAGLNAVETYVPWNLHEYKNGMFDFGTGGSDFEDFLDVVSFIKLAKEEDLFVILRPGPYICAEWEFGGLPSWLLRYERIKVRTTDIQYMYFVRRYLKKLFNLLSPLQFTKGGAIIAIQIENEYGDTKDGDKPVDRAYLEQLKDIFQENGIVELLFTSDKPSLGFSGTLPGVLATANFQNNATNELTILKKFQPHKPLMVMEYWTGWYDHWTETHHTRSAKEFAGVFEEILSFGASVNLYMFHGGTNWGFLNGADVNDTSVDNAGYEPVISTYDYDAPLSEAGDYTDKYQKAREIISKHNKIMVKQPSMPDLKKRVVYPPIDVTGEISLDNLLRQSRIKISWNSTRLIPMELLPINDNSGQSFGYIVYKKTNINIPKNSTLTIEGRVCDTVLVLINGKLKSKILESKDDLEGFGYWKLKNSILNLGDKEYRQATLELVVENLGRVNYGKLYQFNQFKGLWQGNILLNGLKLEIEEIIPLEFRKSWTKELKNWQTYVFRSGPKLCKAELTVDEPRDTYLDMRNWHKGIVIINGFILSRYMKLGPQQTVYLPAPLLKKGANILLIFEHFIAQNKIEFVEDPIFQNI
ncbi:beta-galactosidase-1-like protein 3 [Leptinotarsa decemlineata]|uniref:beta-galactosidase-1-like protein 3 n=1 Tax=Leptinotarsa decemlineata TaxID=7539 RepID=UPI003D308236